MEIEEGEIDFRGKLEIKNFIFQRPKNIPDLWCCVILKISSIHVSYKIISSAAARGYAARDAKL